MRVVDQVTMWSGSRFLRSQRWSVISLPLFSSSSLPSAMSHSSALAKDCNAFLPWLEQKAGREISSKLTIGHSIWGRSLFASDFIQEGECLLNVPYSVHLTPDKILPALEFLFSADVSNIVRLAIVFLAEKKLGQDSTWASYVNSLPFLEDMHNTIFWGKDELKMVQPSSVYQETLSQKVCIEKDFYVINHALGHFPQIFGSCTLQDFMYAYSIVGSRAWRTSKGLSLIPFADILNHDGVSESFLLSDDDKEMSEVIADRDYALGEQVMIRYGKFPNSTLLLDFGFTLKDNIHDQVQISIDISQHDPLCKEKLELLHKHSMPTTTKISNLHSSEFSFTIKEVRSAQGKGKGIPQSLRAFARVLSAKSNEELENMVLEAADNDGRLARRPLKDKQREFYAHAILHSHIKNIIEVYDSSIESLGLVGSGTVHCKPLLRRDMARDLLTGELRVLSSAHSWLINYCKSLSSI